MIKALGITALAAVMAFEPAMATTIVGSGKVAKESRAISDISAIRVSGVGTVVIRQGSAESLSVEAEDNLLPYIETILDDDGVLHIGTKKHIELHSMKPPRYGIMVKDLQAIEASGETNVESNGPLRFADLYLGVSGASSLDLDLRAKELVVEVTGASTVALHGNTIGQEVTGSGASFYKAADMRSEYAKVNLSGSTSGEVRVEKQLDAILSGATALNYYGNPGIDANVTGVASLTHKK